MVYRELCVWYTRFAFNVYLQIFIASMMTLAVALSSSAYSGGVISIMEDFGSSRELLIAGISLFVLGFAFGPL